MRSANKIFNEPLFQYSLIAKEKVLMEKAWAAAGVSLVRDIRYESAPGFLFREATHNKILSHIPPEWRKIVRTETAPLHRISPDFYIPVLSGKNKAKLANLTSKNFYEIFMLINAENSKQRSRPFWENRFGSINWELVFKSLFSRDGVSKSDPRHFLSWVYP